MFLTIFITFIISTELTEKISKKRPEITKKDSSSAKRVCKEENRVVNLRNKIYEMINMIEFTLNQKTSADNLCMGTRMLNPEKQNLLKIHQYRKHRNQNLINKFDEIIYKLKIFGCFKSTDNNKKYKFYNYIESLLLENFSDMILLN